MRSAVPGAHPALHSAAALLLAAGLLLQGCEGETPEPAPAAPRPNVLLITIDTLRADALGIYGQTLPTSPNLDSLAAQGVVFDDCISSAPSTLPSHASIMTGKQPYVHGARDNSGYVLTSDNVTLAEVLRAHGYRTAAEVAAAVVGRRSLLNQGFDRYRDLEFPDVTRIRVDVEGVKHVIPERPAADITNRGIEFLQTASEKPFFLWLHYFDPHVFYTAPPLFAQMIPESPYHAEVRYVDAEVSRVLAALHQYRLAERTLVVVTSDHGEGLGEHGEDTHSHFVYDATMRVPLIFWGPSLIPGPGRVDEMVRSIDIAPTILDLLGVPAPSDIQGVSLRPFLEGRSPDLDLVAYGETLVPMLTFNAAVLRFLRDGDWKYIHKVEPELYDVAADPEERNNLAAEHPELRARLLDELSGLLESAPEPSRDAQTSVDPLTEAHLRALGYVTTAARTDPEALRSLELSGPDPASLVQDLRALSAAWAYRKSGQLDLALASFQDLHERHPRSIPVLDGLVGTLALLGDRDAVVAHLRKGIELGSAGARYHANLGAMLAREGEYEEAERLLRQGLELEPCSIVSRVHLSNTLHAQGRYALQLEVLEEGNLRCPDSPDLQNDLAYALATAPEESLRDGARALALVQTAIEAGGGNPSYLDTLAAAYAETGDYESAGRALDDALQLVGDKEQFQELREVLEKHRETVEARQPIRAEPGAPVTAARSVGE